MTGYEWKGKEKLINEIKESSKQIFLFLPYRPSTWASFHSFHTALGGLHWSSSGRRVSPSSSPPHLHLSDFEQPLVLWSFVRPHQVYADKAFLHHPSRPFPFPPLASALSRSRPRSQACWCYHSFRLMS